MPRTSTPRAVPFHEVRHFQPDDCLHYEPISVRGRLHQWVIPTHRHEALNQFQLLERGSARATIDGTVVALRAPVLLMVAAGAMHGFHYEPDSAGHQVTVPTVELRAAFADAPGLQQALARSFVLDSTALGHEAADAVDLLLQLAREFAGRGLGRAEALRAHSLLMALWCLRRAAHAMPLDALGPLDARAPRTPSGSGATSGKPQTTQTAHAPRSAARDSLVQRFRALVDQHYRAHRPLGFYTEALQVSSDHLSRACRCVCGGSALGLVHERMLLEARRLLAYTEMPVARVAGELGFDDAAYFSRLFARKVGLAPAAYRRAAATGLAAKAPPQRR